MLIENSLNTYLVPVTDAIDNTCFIFPLSKTDNKINLISYHKFIQPWVMEASNFAINIYIFTVLSILVY